MGAGLRVGGSARWGAGLGLVSYELDGVFWVFAVNVSLGKSVGELLLHLPDAFLVASFWPLQVAQILRVGCLAIH